MKNSLGVIYNPDMLSVIIPSYKDPLLHKTIESLLENAEREIEIIAVLDDYRPDFPIKKTSMRIT